MTTGAGQELPAEDQQLAWFILRVARDLETVVEQRELLLGRPGLEETLAVMPLAWSEAREDVDPMIGAVLSGQHRQDLARAGLTGAQLQFKILAWRASRDALVAELEDSEDEARPDEPEPVPPWAPDPPPDPPLPKKRPRWMKKALRRLADALAHADTLIDSFKDVVKLGEAFKEFKQVVEKLAGDKADDLPDEE